MMNFLHMVLPIADNSLSVASFLQLIKSFGFSQVIRDGRLTVNSLNSLCEDFEHCQIFATNRLTHEESSANCSFFMREVSSLNLDDFSSLFNIVISAPEKRQTNKTIALLCALVPNTPGHLNYLTTVLTEQHISNMMCNELFWDLFFKKNQPEKKELPQEAELIFKTLLQCYFKDINHAVTATRALLNINNNWTSTARHYFFENYLELGLTLDGTLSNDILMANIISFSQQTKMQQVITSILKLDVFQKYGKDNVFKFIKQLLSSHYFHEANALLNKLIDNSIVFSIDEKTDLLSSIQNLAYHNHSGSERMRYQEHIISITQGVIAAASDRQQDFWPSCSHIIFKIGTYFNSNALLNQCLDQAQDTDFFISKIEPPEHFHMIAKICSYQYFEPVYKRLKKVNNLQQPDYPIFMTALQQNHFRKILLQQYSYLIYRHNEELAVSISQTFQLRDIVDLLDRSSIIDKSIVLFFLQNFQPQNVLEQVYQRSLELINNHLIFSMNCAMVTNYFLDKMNIRWSDFCQDKDTVFVDIVQKGTENIVAKYSNQMDFPILGILQKWIETDGREGQLKEVYAAIKCEDDPAISQYYTNIIFNLAHTQPTKKTKLLSI